MGPLCGRSPNQSSGSRTNTQGQFSSAAFVMKTANGLTDSLVFSDKDDKPYAPSHIPSMSISLWNIMKPHTIRKEEGIEFQVLWSVLCGRYIKVRRVNVRRYELHGQSTLKS